MTDSDPNYFQNMCHRFWKKKITPIYNMEVAEAHWTAMLTAVANQDRKLAKQEYLLYHTEIDNIEKTQGITVSRHQIDVQTMLFIFPPPENISRD